MTTHRFVRGVDVAPGRVPSTSRTQSFTCPHETTVGWAPDGHDIVDFPWPVQGGEQ